MQDEGELGVPNVKAQLFLVATPTAQAGAVEAAAVADTLIGEQMTDATGFYLFTALDPGTYYIVFTKPAGFTVSPRDAGGNDATDSDIDTTGRMANFELPARTVDLTRDAGIYPTPTNDGEDPEESLNQIYLPVIGK